MRYLCRTNICEALDDRNDVAVDIARSNEQLLVRRVLACYCRLAHKQRFIRASGGGKGNNTARRGCLHICHEAGLIWCLRDGIGVGLVPDASAACRPSWFTCDIDNPSCCDRGDVCQDGLVTTGFMPGASFCFPQGTVHG